MDYLLYLILVNSSYRYTYFSLSILQVKKKKYLISKCVFQHHQAIKRTQFGCYVAMAPDATGLVPQDRPHFRYQL